MKRGNRYIHIPRETLEKLYGDGLTQREIARELGVSLFTVASRMAEYGMQLRTIGDYNRVEIPKETLTQLYLDEKLTQREIAKRLGVSTVVVKRLMDEHGIATRTSQDYNYFEISREELEALYHEKQMSLDEIAKMFGVTGATIGRRLREYGIRTRPARVTRPNKKRSDHVEIPEAELRYLYYEQRKTTEEVAKHFGVSTPTLRRRMSEYGMQRRGHQDYVYIDIPKEELLRLYVEQEMTAPAIAKMYGCAVTVVYHRMQEHGIEVRPNGWDKIKFRIDLKRLEWSPDFAYLVGLITSDGDLNTRGKHEVKFNSTDRELIDIYCRILGLRPDYFSSEEWPEPQAPVVHILVEPRPQFDKPMYRVAFSDPAYRARLEGIGLSPKKSNTLGRLDIPDPYFRDFLRGEFDGDGCWYIAKTRGRDYLRSSIVSGSSVFRQWLLETVWRLTNINTGHIFDKAVWFPTGASELLGEYMYYWHTVPRLTRKHTIWLEWMRKRYPLLYK